MRVEWFPFHFGKWEFVSGQFNTLITDQSALVSSIHRAEKYGLILGM